MEAEILYLKNAKKFTEKLLGESNERFNMAMKLVKEYAAEVKELREENAKLRTELREFKFGVHCNNNNMLY